MAILPVTAVPTAAIGLDLRPAVADVVGKPGADFMALVGSGLAQADGSLKIADAQLRRLAAGEAIPLHDVMISLERARVDLMLVTEVRNRLVEAYQELTRMQL
jgi:flagellar hook-basal body complex protein FliE